MGFLFNFSSRKKKLLKEQEEITRKAAEEERRIAEAAALNKTVADLAQIMATGFQEVKEALVKEKTEETVKEAKPKNNPFIRRAYFSNSTLTIFLVSGDMLSMNNVDLDFYIRVTEANSEEEIRIIMLTPESTEQRRDREYKEAEAAREKARQEAERKEAEEAKKRREEFEAKMSLLLAHPDFEKVEDSIRLKGIHLNLPLTLLEGFEETLEGIKDGEEEASAAFNALKNFWMWLSTNGNPASREDAYRFIEQNDVKITPMGQLVLYRGIVSKNRDVNKELLAAISAGYIKVKGWKKSPKNYVVVEEFEIVKEIEQEWVENNEWDEDNEEYEDNGYYEDVEVETKKSVYKIFPASTELNDNQKSLGTLQDLYDGMDTMEENEFTDAHTGKMTIRIGQVYSIDEDKVDRDNRVECSTGLHVGSKDFTIGSFGDTKVMCIVNPSKIRAVPIYDSKKMRVSEMFVAGVLEMNENGQYMDQNLDLVHLDELYFNIELDKLKKLATDEGAKEEAVKNQIIPEITQENLEVVVEKFVDVKEKAKNAIKDRVVNI